MLLIISYLKDTSTNVVCDWLNEYKIRFLRINLEDNVCVEKIEIKGMKTTIKLSYKNQIIDLSRISFVFYRNGFLFQDFLLKTKQLFPNEENLLLFNSNEINTLNDFLFFQLKKKQIFNDFCNAELNKVEVLKLASRIGLKIPQTLVTSKRKQLWKMDEESNDSIITKPLKEAVPVSINEKKILPFTNKFYLRNYLMPDCFFPTLYQKYLDPFCELRIFYFNNEFYSIAIFFSQNPEAKIVDWRSMKSNRFTVFKLPKQVVNKLLRLVKYFKLQSASIDMILTKKFQYYFLEINPVGQFHFLSHHGNFNLEKKIALKIRSVLCKIGEKK